MSSMFGLQFTGMPWASIGYMAGGAAVIITILYLLKLRKRRVQVPYSPLWGRVLQEYKQQSDWWRRLRRLLSWLLQLLLVAGLAFALADPHPEAEIIEGRHILLLIDSSASMGATDVSGGVNRLDIAKKSARQLMDTVGPEDRIMLVNFNKQLQPLSPFVSEITLLEQPLRDIELAATSTNYEDALAFAADSLREVKRGELVVLSDGAGFEKRVMEQIKFAPTTTIRHIKIGESAGNVAVTAFSVRRYLANKLDYELFVQVQSFFDRPIEAELQLLADGRLVDTKPIKLEPNGKLQEFFPSQAVSGERLEARVKVTTLDARDVFPIDDRAYALLPKIERAKIMLITDGNLYLEGTLLLNSNIDVERLTPTEYAPEKLAGFDVVIFDRFAPATLPTAGNFVFVDASGENAPWPVSGQLNTPIITTYRKSHPLMRWIGMRDINIGVGSKIKLERGDEVVASSFGDPMIVTRSNDKQKMVGIAFDIRNSDLPLRVAFPVLIINLIDYFQLDEDSLIQNYSTGQTWTIKVPQDEGKATVTTPGKRTIEVPVSQSRAVVYGEQAGFYELETQDKTRISLAANLSDPTESTILPRELTVPDKELQRDAKTLFFDRKELWIWALLIILAVLVLEWWSYNRRVTV